MILSKKDFLRYLEADRIALGRSKMNFPERLIRILSPDYIWQFQRLLRKLEYYKNVRNQGMLNKIKYSYLRLKFKKLSLRLGFTIPENVFGPGLAIVHYGTIVINQNVTVGANCRIHADTNIGASGGTDKAPQIGDNVYIGPGVKIFGDISISSNVAIGANSVVAKSFDKEHVMIAGIPATVTKPIDIKKVIKHV